MDISELEILYDKIYPVFGAGLGAHLADANVVLTLAGARGYTEIFIKRSSREAMEEVCRINGLIANTGVRLEFLKTMSFCGGENSSFDLSKIAIESLIGYEAASRDIVQEGILSGLGVFRRDAGWARKDVWVTNLGKAIREAQKRCKIDSRYNLSSILMGLILGYPFVAIFDCEEDGCRRFAPSRFAGCLYEKLLEGPRERCHLVCANIPWASLYGGDSPNFFFDKAHRDHPKIKAKIETWGKTLKDFYESPWHKKICQNENFVAARQVIESWREDLRR